MKTENRDAKHFNAKPKHILVLDVLHYKKELDEANLRLAKTTSQFRELDLQLRAMTEKANLYLHRAAVLKRALAALLELAGS